MPELPEVETIVRELRSYVIKRKINKVEILRRDCVGYPSIRAFVKGIENKTIKDITRKGKYIIFHLHNVIARSVATKQSQSRGLPRSLRSLAMTNESDNESLLIIHLRLSGQLLVFNSNTKHLPKFERIRFHLSGKKILGFIEPRVLGRAYWLKDENIPDILKGLKNLGLEPIDKKFDYHYLYSKIHNRKAPIKNLLLDQSIASGVGNIYSDEALFIAGIYPLRRANTLKECDVQKLAKALRHVIKSGIESKGTTVSDYLRPDGSEGTYQFKSFVFDREGEPCRVCKTKIEFKRIGNRRTRYCPKCQPK